MKVGDKVRICKFGSDDPLKYKGIIGEIIEVYPSRTGTYYYYAAVKAPCFNGWCPMYRDEIEPLDPQMQFSFMEK